MKSRSSSSGKKEMIPENVIKMFEQLEEIAMSDASEASRVRAIISIMTQILGELP
jgi:hypothetical protein